MRNIRKIGLIGICAFSFLTTGCGSNHELNCELKSGSSDLNIKIEYNSDETIIKKATIESVMEIGEEYTDELIEQLKEFTLKGCKDSGGINCKVKIEGKKLINTFEEKDEFSLVDNNNIKIDDLIEEMEGNGFTCKK